MVIFSAEISVEHGIECWTYLHFNCKIEEVGKHFFWDHFAEDVHFEFAFDRFCFYCDTFIFSFQLQLIIVIIMIKKTLQAHSNLIAYMCVNFMSC